MKRINVKYVKEFQNGSIEAFEKIYRYYNRPLYYFLYSILNSDADTEEVLQLTFIRVYKKIHHLKKPDSFQSWLYRIAYTQAMSLHVKERNQVALDAETNLEEVISDKTDVEIEYNGKELKDLLVEEVNNLSPKLREVAILKYFEDMAVKEIAIVLDIPIGTVKSRLSAIRDIIKPALREQGFLSSRIYSLVFTPFVIDIFEELYTSVNYQETFDSIYINITNGNHEVGAIAATASTGKYFFDSVLAKVLLTTSVVGISTITYQSVVSSEPSIVEEIRYYSELTNKSVEVSVILDNANEVNHYTVMFGDSEIKTTKQDNQIKFVAEDNGEYQIKVEDFQDVITIDSIDKVPPVLSKVTYTDDTLVFDISDNVELDYSTSYIEKDGKQYAINKNHKLQGDFEGSIQFYLFDTAQNNIMYEVAIQQKTGQ